MISSCWALLSCRTKWLPSIILCWCMVSSTSLGAGTRRVDLLRRAGHRVTTLDLASCSTHPADPSPISEFAVYNQPLVDLLLSLPETDKVGLVSGRRALATFCS